MKKLAILILAVQYIAATGGASLQLHFCMGEYAGWQLGNKEAHFCSKCGMKLQDGKGIGCCRDELKHARLDVDQFTPENSFFISKAEQELLLSPAPDKINLSNTNYQRQYPVSHAPPRYQSKSIYLFDLAILI